MRFIREHKLFSTIVAVALGLCLVTVFSYKVGGNNGFLGNILGKSSAVIEKPLTQAGNEIKTGAKVIFKFKAVARENEQLKDEVSNLEKQITELTLKRHELEQLTNLSKALNYEGIKERNSMVAANIISLDSSDFFHFFTIDRGKESGIKTNSIVVNGEGLVGRVTDTGNGWSKVVSIIDESNNVSSMVLRDMNILAIATGDGEGKLSGYTIANNAGIIEGDVLITSNIGMYPQGIKIGRVLEVKYNPDTQLKTLKIEPAVSFNNLQKVAVIV